MIYFLPEAASTPLLHPSSVPISYSLPEGRFPCFPYVPCSASPASPTSSASPTSPTSSTPSSNAHPLHMVGCFRPTTSLAHRLPRSRFNQRYTSVSYVPPAALYRLCLLIQRRPRAGHGVEDVWTCREGRVVVNAALYRRPYVMGRERSWMTEGTASKRKGGLNEEAASASFIRGEVCS